jgi:hypothetical protein
MDIIFAKFKKNPLRKTDIKKYLLRDGFIEKLKINNSYNL